MLVGADVRGVWEMTSLAHSGLQEAHRSDAPLRVELYCAHFFFRREGSGSVNRVHRTDSLLHTRIVMHGQTALKCECVSASCYYPQRSVM